MNEVEESIDLLRPAQAAAFLNVHYVTFNRWINAGAKIPCVITGKRRRYTKQRLREWANGRDLKAI